jgi:hypothetical protein
MCTHSTLMNQTEVSVETAILTLNIGGEHFNYQHIAEAARCWEDVATIITQGRLVNASGSSSGTTREELLLRQRKQVMDIAESKLEIVRYKQYASYAAKRKKLQQRAARRKRSTS